MTKYNASVSELTQEILEISRAHQPYIFVSNFQESKGIIIKYQTSNHKGSIFKRYSLSHSQADTFIICCGALGVPIYTVRKGLNE